jgi:nucleoside-diphosphate-sugar epimerase
VLDGLLARGHDVTIFHRGVHEPPGLPDVEHVHGDPHFRRAIDEALGARTWDAVLAMYGRVKHLAPALAGRCGQFVAVGGVPVYRGFFPRPGYRMPVPVTEDDPVVQDAPDGDRALRFSARLAEAEDAVFAAHPAGTVLRYPALYGPDNTRPWEWSVVRRVRDGRPHMVLPDGGHQVHTRCSARNAAAHVLAAVDRPGVAAGQVYNCGDPFDWSMRQWVEATVELLGGSLEVVAIPSDVAVEAATTLLPLGGTTATHSVMSTAKARRDLGPSLVDPLDALRELVSWYRSRPDLDPGAGPAFTDRFDYAGEDALISAYRRAVAGVLAAVPQQAGPVIHSMPHPREPGTVDHRGR